MRARTLFLSAAALCAGGAFIFLLVTMVTGLPADAVPVNHESVSHEIDTVDAPRRIPVTLLIPSLDITAPVEPVGVNERGNMKTPSNFSSVAWYYPGSAPGQRGSAVFAGHLDNGLGIPGVFKHLKELALGEKIFITDEEGREIAFVVSEMATYPIAEVPLARVFAQIGTPMLVLITCDGTWVPAQKTYDQRLVVFATQVL